MMSLRRKPPVFTGLFCQVEPNHVRVTYDNYQGFSSSLFLPFPAKEIFLLSTFKKNFPVEVISRQYPSSKNFWKEVH